MGFARDLGAAATFGLSSTTKHKEAQKTFENRRTLHQQRLNSYNDTQAQLQASVDAMDSHFAAAQEVLLSTGALVPDAGDNITYGWYRPQEEVDGVDNNPDYKRSSIGAIPAFGIGMSTPAAIWTLVGIYGTAATGTAIGTLTGAAAGSATAAWIGRAVTMGMGGMTAGRIALGPIGVAASLVTIPIGAAIAGNRERNYIKRTKEAMRKMDRLEEIIGRCRSRMMQLRPRITVTTADLQRHTGQLETTTPDTTEAQEIVSKIDADMRKAAEAKNELVEIINQRDKAIKAAGIATDST